VDITMGASTGEQHVTIAAGTRGRPALNLLQPWVVKGVATRLVTGIDQASAALALIVLAAAALVVLDAVFATVRARRREIATVLALGWRGRDVTWGVLTPVLAAAAFAGAIGAGAAVAVRRVLGLIAPPGTGLIAIPAAIGVALIAATWPALAAARTAPASAMAPAASARGLRLAPRVASVTGAAWRSLASAPGRAAASILGAATATAAIGTLRTIQDDFASRAVGTVLGNAITVQVRTPDLAAAGLTALLAGIGIHHVVATEARERRTELGTLAALGWRPRTITRLLATQALLATALGVVIGAAVVVLITHGAFGASVPAALRASSLAGAMTLAITALATVPALVRVRRRVPARLLRDE
jgi:ABC-type antimicrobial peptide transport system permease subunit